MGKRFELPEIPLATYTMLNRSSQLKSGLVVGNASGLRGLNANQVLDLIRRHGPISRAALAKISGLSKPTISQQVDALIRGGLAVESGTGKSARAGGKKPIMVRFNAEFGSVVSVDMATDEVRVALADLSGNITKRLTGRMSPSDSLDQVLGLIRELLSDLAFSQPSVAETVQAICVGCPGRVDPERGVILKADLFGWRDVRVSDYLASRFHRPVLAENDVNLAMIGEFHHGCARGARNAVLVRLHRGIGSGILINGSLYRGSHWAAGEIAHFVLGPLGADADTTVRGQLEWAVGLDRIVDQAHLPSPSPAGPDDVVSLLLESANAGDATSKAVLEDLLARIAGAVANLVAAFDPDMVIFSGGPLVRLSTMIGARVTRGVPWPVEIVQSNMGDDAVLLGGVDLALEYVYEQISRRLCSDPVPAVRFPIAAAT